MGCGGKNVLVLRANDTPIFFSPNSHRNKLMWPRRSRAGDRARVRLCSEDTDRGAVPEGSRWSSAAPTTGTPRGPIRASQRDARGHAHTPDAGPLARLRRAETVLGCRVRWCRCAQPPAKLSEPSGFTGPSWTARAGTRKRAPENGSHRRWRRPLDDAPLALPPMSRVNACPQEL